MTARHRFSPHTDESQCERATQLRREAVAAMKLRSATTLRFTRGSCNAADAFAPGKEARQTRILAISDYEGLRASREQVLRLDGYQVESVQSTTTFDDAWVRLFDVAILCQSV